MEPGFELLLEDGPCLAVNKPPGLLTQAPPGIDSLELRIKRWLKQRDNKPGGVYLGVPHRLDRPVSGVMVFAKHVRAARRLSEQFEARAVRKTYWALVEGTLATESGTWTDQIKKLDYEPRAVLAEPTDPEGRTAILHFHVLERLAGFTWLEIELETGRMHQIRLQCSARRHPLLGDDLYGSQQPFGPATSDPRERLIALHARSLSFRHPMSGAALVIHAPLTSYWRELGVREENAPAQVD